MSDTMMERASDFRPVTERYGPGSLILLPNTAGEKAVAVTVNVPFSHRDEFIDHAIAFRPISEAQSTGEKK